MTRNRRRAAAKTPTIIAFELLRSPGWTPATDAEIEAILEAVPADRRHAVADALEEACEGFGQANFGLRPTERVLRGLALGVLPVHAASKRGTPELEAVRTLALEAACSAVDVVSPDRWWIRGAFEAYDAALNGSRQSSSSYARVSVRR